MGPFPLHLPRCMLCTSVSTCEGQGGGEASGAHTCFTPRPGTSTHDPYLALLPRELQLPFFELQSQLLGLALHPCRFTLGRLHGLPCHVGFGPGGRLDREELLGAETKAGLEPL